MRALVVVLSVGLLLAGCVNDSSPEEGAPEGGEGTGTDNEGSGGQNDVGGSTSPGVQRTESDVTTGQSGGRWFARQTVILKNDASAGVGDATFETVAGGVEVVARSGNEYQVTVSLEGRGDTKQEALDRLEEMDVDHTDEGAWTLATRVSDDSEWTDQNAAIHAAIPSSTTWGSIVARTVSGGVTIEDHEADAIEGETISGGVTCSSIQASSLTLYTSSGGIDCDGTAADADVTATSGSIELDLRASASGDWQFSTTSGGIDLTVPEDSSRGYDITAETTSGGIDFHFQDTEVISAEEDYSGESRHERTNGFATRVIQTTIDLEAVSGGIEAGS